MKDSSSQSRRHFIKQSALAGFATVAGTITGCAANGKTSSEGQAKGWSAKNISDTRPRPLGNKPVHQLTTKPLEKVRVGIIGCGGRGNSLLGDLLTIEFVEVVAVCDLRKDRAQSAANRVEKAQRGRPVIFGGTEQAWEGLCDLDKFDVVYVATPWEWHVSMAVRAMELGKHAFVEVSAAITVADCWRLVDTSEQQQRHCVMLENCCYGENELFVLNLVRQGVFGELTHAECGYIHDLRGMLYTLGTEGDWRRDYHQRYDGNLYPTHGLGPVAQYLGINRGDQFKFLVSMSSPEKGLSRWRNDKRPNNGKHEEENYICGDMNTSLIKTELGRSIMIQHDVVSPRPYSRINALSGTGATFFDYPARLALNAPGDCGLKATGSHDWLTSAELRQMQERFGHPLWRKLSERAKSGGHGGMDFVMNWRHLDCIRQGVTPDSVVYDAAAWSCILELSAHSIAHGSVPCNIPDFTRGIWKSMQPLPIVT